MTPYVRFYPAFLNIKGKVCVVVGGGVVAERKVVGLLRAGALVKVVSPTLTERLGRDRQKGKITHIARRFRKGDLKGAFLAVAATDDEAENRKIAAENERIPVNVVDRPELCSFIVPSTLRRGPLQIAVSTSGASPATARAIRLELEKLYGPEMGRRLEKLRAERERVRKQRRKGDLKRGFATPFRLGV